MISADRTQCRCGLSWDTGDAHPPLCPHLLGDDDSEADRFAGLVSGLLVGAAAVIGVIAVNLIWLWWKLS